MNSARSVSVLIASFLLVALAGLGIVGADSTYRFEIEKRQERIDEIMRALEKLDHDLKVRQAMFADFVKVHCVLEMHAAKLEVRGARFDFASHPLNKVHGSFSEAGKKSYMKHWNAQECCRGCTPCLN